MKTHWRRMFLVVTLALSSCGTIEFLPTSTAPVIQNSPQPTAMMAGPATNSPVPPTLGLETQAPLPTASMPVTATAIPVNPTQGVETQMAPASPTQVTPAMQGMLETARQDLAKRLSISESGINLVRASAVNWSDSSLGCPQPGMAYAQIITPGYLVLLSDGSRQYEYHAGRDQLPFYCKNPKPPSALDPGSL
jgi:hypothetical protein